ncbi:hypothetical protein [Oceanirhabdus sp. W0125-5]|uniref:hypothetical protein n=1 Tax=Oceanirhabdus sp. W0125-5 TaxID=2999116 RepID=UPI0022F2D817|nr:hypothetical protein [Oceanirhabdus sp. W0125-5]WBW96074.1 hypothetical protein OW730_20620 [Oceanirhabdus sp. W0125-5]
MEKLNKEQIIELIQKLKNAEGADDEQNEWVCQIEYSVPFYQDIVRLLFWSNKVLTAKEIYEEAEKNHNPIIL